MKAFYNKYQGYFPAAFFVGGFAFDILTTGRIDQTTSLVQQLGYLLVLMLFMYWEVTQPRIFLEGHKFFQFLWKYHVEALHFFFGCLLSLYTIFYFKSASFMTSFIFMSVLASLLVINEWPRFQRMGVTIRFSMLAICLSSYFIYLVPVVTGQIGLLAFIIAMVLSMSLFLMLILRLEKRIADANLLIYRALLPGLAVNLIFCALYLLKILPPVPLSLEYIGIYHDIKKQGQEYHLHYERADWWRFWENGAQTFLSQDGDKIYCFVRVFSPTKFKDDIHLEWYQYGKKGWQKWDSIPLPIQGGRSLGYRGYAHKSNYEPGQWQVRVVTSDDREMGRIYFSVQARNNDEARLLKLDIR